MEEVVIQRPKAAIILHPSIGKVGCIGREAAFTSLAIYWKEVVL